MFKGWCFLFLLVTAGFLTMTASAQFVPPYIADYQVEVNLHRDSTLTVTETIAVNFGQVLRHGIYRKVPFRYERSVKGVPVAYKLRIRLISVTDEHGNPYHVKAWRDGDYIFWRIGDPKRYVSGKKTYKITYSVARAVNFFDDQDELYWNATGNEWEWDIAKTHCVVNLPQGVDMKKVKATFYTGHFGSQEQNGQIWREVNRWHFVTWNLRQGEGLTIVIGLPKGLLQPPSAAKATIWFLADNWGFIIAVLLPLIAFATMFHRYWRYGRDPIWRESIAVQYYPPDNLTPAEVGILVDEQADNIDIVATVIDLAVKGYLKIREVETEKFLFLKGTDYDFVFLRNDDSGLKRHEQIVLNGLKIGLDKGAHCARLSELKERFYTYLERSKDALYSLLTREGYFAQNPEKVRSIYIGTGIFIGIAILVTGSFLAAKGVPAGASFIVSGLLTGFAIAAFAPAMPRKTSKGAKALWHILGLREFIRRVEKDRLERMLQEDPTLFDRVLPYALVFGVADEWAEKFEGLLHRPPDWYESDRWTPTTFSTRVFVLSLGDSVSSMKSVFPSSPSRSSGAGGGSSGFGRGGFSGGGFGGGGGGGW